MQALFKIKLKHIKITAELPAESASFHFEEGSLSMNVLVVN